ncbi:uncharacterized protein LOC128246081 [Mya arenaria]|uniref:uncharacterized protein LOC128246081 n=1 Tax=Mya arenaria TaxID=6604 RepID=UPI0022E24CB5|nr:uncharacterized protein LOC128246081 [Mya arenaria]
MSLSTSAGAKTVREEVLSMEHHFRSEAGKCFRLVWSEVVKRFPSCMVRGRKVFPSCMVRGRKVFRLVWSEAGRCVRLVKSEPGSCFRLLSDSKVNRYYGSFLDRHRQKLSCAEDRKHCETFYLPKNYNAYHLNGKTITIDGRLNDDAWKEVSWSSDFVDMRSERFPTPFFTTKFKLRWDDANLYVGAYVQEKDVYATKTQHDDQLWKENGFEMLMAIDGTLFNYKQVQVNALGTTMYQLLFKSPYEAAGKPAWENPDYNTRAWEANLTSQVNVDGTINQPGDEDKFWTVEISIPFRNLALNSNRSQIDPKPYSNEVWFMQFGRSEQNLTVANGSYVPQVLSEQNWWSWQPCGTINLHLQDRWGLVQFKRNRNDKKFRYKKWHVYRTLFDVMNAMDVYKALNGKFTDNIAELDIPPYLMTATCVKMPEIKLLSRENGTKGFEIGVKSLVITQLPMGHIREDRYVWFR